jgi:murein DD-endopeptidase MepM/ murein hydrolase activator NlpD
MRILTALLTAMVAALAGLGDAGGGASPAADAAADVPCTPHASAWTWPLSPTPLQSVQSSHSSRSSHSYKNSQNAPDPVVVRPFEPPRHRWDPGHRGIDVAGFTGEPVLSAGPGLVLYAGFLVDRPVVVVGHGVLRTTYEPVAPDPSIVVGVRVRRGQRIGTLAAGHCPGASCLHWGLVAGHGHAAVYYDPLLLLGCGGVRLEPVDPAG